MRFSVLFIILGFVPAWNAQNCQALYSYGATFTNVHFFNQTNVPNAHYYWNFGDGTSSDLKDPIHDFPENGSYLVTLYVHDTIGNCSGYYEKWLSISKYSTNPCSPILGDSIYSANGNDYIKFINSSLNCNSYNPKISTLGDGGWGPYVDTYLLPKIPGLFISALRYYDGNWQFQNATAKTLPRYDRSKNYQDCSANFEFKVVDEDAGGQTFLFKAMNKNAVSYKWYFTGFGDPIIKYTDTAYCTYWGDINATSISIPHAVYLVTVGQNGCKDSLVQSINVRKKSSTYVGIRENEVEQKTNFFPNPTLDELSCIGCPIFEKITITTALGEIIGIVLNPPSERGMNISLGAYPPGVYFLIAENKYGKEVSKVIKR